MKKFLIAIAVMVSLASQAQEFIYASVSKNADPTKIDIWFKANYTSVPGPPFPPGEYINYLQFSMAIPVGVSAGVTATAVFVNNFAVLPGALGTGGAGSSYTEGSEQIFDWSYLNTTAVAMSWTANTEFIGIQVTFSGPNQAASEAAAAVGKMLDLTNSPSGLGGTSGLTQYVISTSANGDVTDLTNMFYARPGQSFLGTYTYPQEPPNTDQFVQTGGGTPCTAGTVSGTSPLCIEGMTTYTSNGDAGGTWSSSNPAVATVNPSSGLVTAVSAGTTNITYTACSPSVSSFKTLTVDPNISAGTVSGTSPLCIGATNTYTSNGTTGGSWSSTVPSVASVDAASGLVTALTAGTTNITYTVSSGCGSPASSFKTLTVSPNVTAGTVSGTSPLCIGQTATYTSNGTGGGSWSSSNTSVATVNSSTGVVTAVSAGTTNIIYTVSSGCNAPQSASNNLTVSTDPTPGTVSGTSPLCIGATAQYSSSGSGGGAWSSSNTSVATVNSSTGVVTAVSAGTTNIVYTVNACNGSPLTASQNLTVSPNVSAGTVSGTSPLCIGQTATYTSNGTGGGSWSSSNTAVATVNSSTGVVTAVSAGTTNITYTVSAGCGSPASASQNLTVSPNANAGTVSGTSPLCVGATAQYSSTGTAGGTWSSSNTSVATVNSSTGLVTAAGAGTTNITYTVSSGCNAPQSASKNLTVSTDPTPGTVSGTSPLCIGATAQYSSSGSGGGAWSSSNTAVATVNSSTGIVTAVSAGTTNIVYTVNACNGSPLTASQNLTVSPSVSAGTVSGTSPLCIGQTATYTSNGTGGGSWGSSNTAVATVNSSTGVVTAASAGTTNITYTVSAGCGSPASASQNLTISPNANAGTVSGTSPLCVGATAQYSSNGDGGGAWSSSNTSVATVNSLTGLVTAAGAGTTNITYTVSSGCNAPQSASKNLTVSTDPTPGTVSGTLPLCIGATAQYSSSGSGGGAWSSSNTSVATVSSTGVVTAVSAGTTDIVYTVNACNGSQLTASQNLTVSPDANAGTVSGTSPLCVGATAQYSSNGDGGGAWSSSNTSVATVNSSTGLVTAAGAGTTNITYTVSSGCNAPQSASKNLTVSTDPTPGTVSGTSPLCIGATAQYSSSGSGGGAWSSSNTSVATVNSSTGVVTAVSAGTTDIVYTVNACDGSPLTASQNLTVDPSVSAGTVSGTSPLCIGQTATYTSNGTGGGSWSSTVPAVASVDAASGLVTAVAAGTTDITYTVSSGCGSPISSFQTLTVDPNANAGTVSGTSPLCIGATATYTSSGDAGGSWSSTNTAVATVNSSTGLVTAVSVGTTDITYTVSSGCNNPVSSFKALTVSTDPSPGTVSGTSPLCIGATAQYSSSGSGGGAWSSSNTSVATVNSSTGVVTAVSAGTTDIVYTVNACDGSPLTASQNLTVDPSVSAGTVSGTSPLCIGQTATYTSNGTGGGSWSSTVPAVASVDAASGLVTAVAAGTTDITYTVSSGCGSPISSFQTLTVDPNANAGTVSGTSPLCIGATATYTSSGDAGGSWSSTNTAVATVNSSTGLVTAVSVGTTDITYTVSSGCGSPISSFQTLTVDPNANAGTVSGTSPLCIGATATYTSSGDAGGSWSSTNTAVATVNSSTGLVTAVSAGTTNITYTVSGCGGPVSSFKPLTVNPNVTAGSVSGTTPLIVGATATYSSSGTSGGSWSSTNAAVATVNSSSGLVTAVSAGTTNITYTVSGCGGPVSSFQTLTVITSGGCTTTVTISASSPNDFCSNLTLRANPALPGAYTYQWKRGAIVVGDQQTLNLTLADPDGVYTVTLTGCTAPPASYNYQKQNLSQSYTILSLRYVDISEFNHVQSGSVGSTYPFGLVYIGRGSTIASPGFAKARFLFIHPLAIVPVRYAGSRVTATLPTMQLNNTTPSGSNLIVTSNSTIAGNYRNVTVRKNVIVTFTTGTIFKKLTLEEGAKATFNQPVINFEAIEMKNGKAPGSGNRTRLNFAGNTSVRVEEGVEVGAFGRINEGGYKVTFYVEDEDFDVKGQGTRIVANVYASSGDIHVHFDVNHNANSNQPVYMTGQFIARGVLGHERNTYWNSYNCNANNSIPTQNITAIPEAEATESRLQVSTYPNPSETFFNLTATSKRTEELNIAVYNMVGVKVQQIKALPGQVVRLGDHFVSGTYLIEVRQGIERVITKVVKF